MRPKLGGESHFTRALSGSGSPSAPPSPTWQRSNLLRLVAPAGGSYVTVLERLLQRDGREDAGPDHLERELFLIGCHSLNLLSPTSLVA